MIWCDWQDGEAAVELLTREEDMIVLRDAINEYNHSFILK